jgi:hypothetical protein
MKLRYFRSAVLSGVLVALASPGAQACAVCFGKTDSPLGKGLHWGVLALLGFVFLTLAAFGAFAVFLVRRSIATETADGLELESERPSTLSAPSTEIH